VEASSVVEGPAGELAEVHEEQQPTSLEHTCKDHIRRRPQDSPMGQEEVQHVECPYSFFRRGVEAELVVSVEASPLAEFQTR
jgi:hypothetical protein